MRSNSPVGIPLAFTLLLHTVLALLLIFKLDFAPAPKVLPTPQIVQAKLVKLQSNPVQRQAAKPAPKPTPEPEAAPLPEPPKPEPRPEPRPEPPKPDPAKLQQEKKRQEEQALAERKKVEEAKKKAEEEKRKKAEAEKKAEELRRKQEEERKRKAQQEAERKRREELARQELAKALAAEEQAMAQVTEGELVASYGDLIRNAVERSWSRPPSARRGMRAVLQIQLIPTGEVVDVAVVQSSGSEEFDRSAINAVKRVGQFPELKQLASENPRAFEQNFRRFRLDFYPEDLRL